MKIGVIGVGRLGLCFALLVEKAGYTVVASDNREDYIQDLRKGVVGTTEPNVHDLLWNSKNITFTTNNCDVIEECDLIFTFVATPSLEDGSYDVSAVEKVVQDITTFSSVDIPKPAGFAVSKLKGKSLVVGCTTNPGDCNRFEKELDYFGMDVYYNPEFIAQGSIVSDLQKPDIVLICGDGRHAIAIEGIYRKIVESDCSVHCMSTKAGEIVKIAINTFLTTKISYANLLGEVLALSGLSNEIDSVLGAIGNDSRIGKKYLNYGFGFGGPCFPRDNRSFASYANSVGVEFNIGETTDNFNNEHAKFLKDYFIKDNKDKLPFCFRYIAYKEGTDILTESQQYRLCLDLLDEGYKVYVIDGCVKDYADGRIVFEEPNEEVYWINL